MHGFRAALSKRAAGRAAPQAHRLHNISEKAVGLLYYTLRSGMDVHGSSQLPALARARLAMCTQQMGPLRCSPRVCTSRRWLRPHCRLCRSRCLLLPPSTPAALPLGTLRAAVRLQSESGGHKGVPSCQSAAAACCHNLTIWPLDRNLKAQHTQLYCCSAQRPCSPQHAACT